MEHFEIFCNVLEHFKHFETLRNFVEHLVGTFWNILQLCGTCHPALLSTIAKNELKTILWEDEEIKLLPNY